MVTDSENVPADFGLSQGGFASRQLQFIPGVHASAQVFCTQSIHGERSATPFEKVRSHSGGQAFDPAMQLVRQRSRRMHSAFPAQVAAVAQQVCFTQVSHPGAL
jgi:hypothetical protein